MILQALVEHYETLVQNKDETIPQFGWSRATASFCVLIDLDGNLKNLVSLVDENKKGQPVTVPLQLKRSGKNPPPYFLCDSATYVLGLENGELTKRSQQYFENFRIYHRNLLSQMPCAASTAVCNFLERWNPQIECANPIVQAAFAQGMGRGNLIFRITDTSERAHCVKEIIEGWNRYYQQWQDDVVGICMVTGNSAPIARIHNSVKGIYASALAPNGWTLVGFDKGSPAFSSYGKEQGYNAPTSQYAAFAYTAALNHLLADRERVCRIGDATVVFWAKSGETAYSDCFLDSLFDEERKYEPEELQAMMASLSKGKAVTYDQNQLDPNMQFYVLGLSPNAARLSVRFFLQNSFGNLVANAKAHQERLEIVRPSFDKFVTMPLWALLRETVNENSRDKAPAPNLAGEVLRSILNNTPYPATLLQGVQLRIRAERRVTRGRAAIIKAYYLKKPHPEVPEEVLTVALNRESNNVPYTLGRLFSVLEAIQEAANPGINATIQDRYFNSASSTPARVFPTLLNLSQKHLKKLSGGLRITYERQVTELLGKLPESFPAQFSLPQQGSFQLGYYHQTQARYEKREEN